MTIESGPTRERLIRWGLFAAMCAVACFLFLRDALVKYPHENARQAAENLPQATSGEVPKVNPRVTRKNVAALLARAKTEGLVVEDLKAVLGEPAFLEVDREAYWVGRTGWVRFALAGTKVVFDPSHDEADEIWINAKHTENDLMVQLLLGSLTGALMLWAGYLLVSAARTRVVLNDQGLMANGRGPIEYARMRSLDTSEYARKGRVTLRFEEAGKDAALRLDSYHVARFREIVTEICNRRGFPMPFATNGNSSGSASSSEAAAENTR